MGYLEIVLHRVQDYLSSLFGSYKAGSRDQIKTAKEYVSWPFTVIPLGSLSRMLY